MPEDRKAKYAIEVTEHTIRNECFDPFMGGPSPYMDGDHFFVIPIDEILAFTVALQLRFPNVSTRQIVKWPEKIDSALRKIGLTYEARFGDDPTLINLEKEDPSFFSEHGHPQIATYGSLPTPWFDGQCAYYHFDLEVFTPDTARRTSRLAGTSLLPPVGSALR